MWVLAAESVPSTSIARALTVGLSLQHPAPLHIFNVQTNYLENYEIHGFDKKLTTSIKSHTAYWLLMGREVGYNAITV